MSRPGTLADTVPAEQARSAARRGRRLFSSRSAIGVLMCLPLIALIGGLVAYPFFYAIYLSMLNKRETLFVGLANFTSVVTTTKFQTALRNTFVFAISAQVAVMVLATILALALLHEEREHQVARGEAGLAHELPDRLPGAVPPRAHAHGRKATRPGPATPSCYIPRPWPRAAPSTSPRPSTT